MVMVDVPVRNFLKVKVLLFLNEAYQSFIKSNIQEKFFWHHTLDISAATSTSMNSLHVILPRWSSASWGYVDCYRFDGEVMTDKRKHKFYKINGRGLSYLARLDHWYKYRSEAQKVLDSFEGGRSWPDIKPIIFPAFPGANTGEQFISMDWPFNIRDISVFFAGGKYIRVDDINQAINVAHNLFHIEPPINTIKYALKLQEKIAEKNGIRVSFKIK